MIVHHCDGRIFDMIGIDHMIRWSGVDDVTMVAAHPNDGATALGQIDSSDIVAVPISRMNTSQPLKQTQKLTVWRTLNVECDRMYISSGRDENGNMLPYTLGNKIGDELSITEYMINELGRACIYPVLWNGNTNPYTAGSQEINVTELVMYTDMRNISATTPDFWTVHMISMFEESTHGIYCGVYAYSLNTLAIFSETIFKKMESENDTSTDFNLARQTTIIHEIGHAFNLEDVEYIDGSTWSQDYGVMVSECPISVYVEEGNMSFTSENLKTIQRQANIKYISDAE